MREISSTKSNGSGGSTGSTGSASGSGASPTDSPTEGSPTEGFYTPKEVLNNLIGVLDKPKLIKNL